VKSQIYLGFSEREYLRAQLKGTNKREKSQIYLGFSEREYLRAQLKGTNKREKNQKFLEDLKDLTFPFWPSS
jgi:hypothetical protein